MPLGPLTLTMRYCIPPVEGSFRWATTEHVRYLGQETNITSFRVSDDIQGVETRSKRWFSRHMTFFAGQPTALFSLAYTVSQDCPPAHILECPCPTRPFQCEMDVFQGPCLD